MPSTAHERRRAAREIARQRALMGETLAEFHRRENPPRQAPGADIPRVRCERTPDMFTGLPPCAQQPGLFDNE